MVNKSVPLPAVESGLSSAVIASVRRASSIFNARPVHSAVTVNNTERRRVVQATGSAAAAGILISRIEGSAGAGIQADDESGRLQTVQEFLCVLVEARWDFQQRPRPEFVVRHAKFGGNFL